jgi:small subunit ribosomal protein S6
LRTYEALYIVTPELDDDGIQTVAKGVEAFILKHEGTIVRSEIWGKRKLAYEVKKHTEGAYVLVRFTASADFLARLENFFKLAESIIRYLVVHFDERTMRLEAEQIRRKEEDIRASAAAKGRGRDDDDDDDDDGPANASYGSYRHRDRDRDLDDDD